MPYKALYVYTDENHPKRGHRYLHHFEITGRYPSAGIIKVLWHTDKKPGYVREGEFQTLESFNTQFHKEEAEARRKREVKWFWDQHTLKQLGREIDMIWSDMRCANARARRKEEERNSFRLECS